jgi:TolB-like protein/Flp pilus assembly protein TadD
MKDIFEIQDEITLSVVDALKLKLLGDEKEDVLKRYTKNAEAYQLYLRGRFFFFKRTPEGFKKAIEYFQQAIQLDAEYALAYSGLADSYTFLGFYEHLAPAEAENNLKGPAFKSLELDDTLAETRTSVALYKSLYKWDFVEADKDHKRAIALNPKYAFAHHLDSATAVLLGRNDEAIAAETRAVELEPFTAIFNASLGWWFYLAHRNDEAIAQSLRTIEIAPNHFFAYWVLGLAYGLAEKYEDAIAAFQKGLSLTSAQHIKADLARIYGQAGRRDEALAVLSDLSQEAKQQYISAANLAKIYLGLGEIGHVYEQLEQAITERAVKLPWFMLDPMLDQLRAEPRFRDIWRRIGLPQNGTAQRNPTEASEAHTVVIDSAEHRSGKATSAESSDPGQGSDVEGGDLSPLPYVATGRDDAGDGSPASTAPTSRRTPNRPLRRKIILIIGLTILFVTLATVGYRSFPNRGGGQINSIAVMPFVNASGNADVEYLSDGMTETLISSLSQLPNLNVKGRSSVFRYKGKDTNPQTIGKELNVQAVLNGRVAQRGDQLTLTLELVDAQTENVIWSEQYNRRQADLVTLQSEIARDVSSKLKTKLSGADEVKVTKKYTANPEAYQLYLKGRFQWNKRTGESLKQAVEFYKQAIEKDPNYALAYAGSAQSYVIFNNYSVASSRDSMPQAKAATLHALALDDSLDEAHAALGLYLSAFAWNQPAAEKELRRAIELNPNNATAYQWLGVILALAVGRSDEGIAAARRAEELDPLSPVISADSGFCLFGARRYDEAIAQLKRALTLDPNFYYTRLNLGAVYHAKGMYSEAIAEYRRARELDDDPVVTALLARSLTKSGGRDEAAKLRDQLRAEAARRYVPNVAFALVYAALDDKDEAFKWLEKDFAERTHVPSLYAFYPLLDDLRNDPRFADLVRRVELAKTD